MSHPKVGILSTSLGNSGGGVSTVIGEHIRNMPYGIQALAFSSARPGLIDNIDKNRCDIHLSYSPFDGRLSFFPGAIIDIHRLKPTVIHQHGIWGFPSICALAAHHLDKIPTVISPHGMLDPWILSKGKKLKHLMNALFQKSNIMQARYMHALNTKEAQQIREYGYTGEIVIIPNGVEPQQVRAELFKNEILNITYLGRIDEKKNVLELAQAVRHMPPKRPIRLNIYGWGSPEYQRKLEAEIQKCDSIIFHGSVFGEAKRNALLNSDVFILPSQSEGLPMAVLEAWSYGVPCIISENCNLPEGINTGAALLTDINVDGIADSIERFCALSHDAVELMASRAKDLVESRFTWHRIMQSFEAVYSSSSCMSYDSNLLTEIIFNPI